MVSPQEKALMKEFGKRVSELRRKRGMTQEQLAGALEVSLSTVAFIETGARWVRLVTLRKIAAVLKVKISQLFEGVQ